MSVALIVDIRLRSNEQPIPAVALRAIGAVNRRDFARRIAGKFPPLVSGRILARR